MDKGIARAAWARRWSPLLSVFLIALALRCLYIWQIHDAPFFDLRMGDGKAYHLWAQRIAAGDWLGQGVFYQAPLYPYFLAFIYRLVGDSTLAVRIVQAILGAASCMLLAAAGISLFGRRGVIAGVLMAVYPPAIFLESLIEKTALISLLTSALLALLVTPPERVTARRWIATGAVLGLLALARENALLLVIPIVAWIAFGPGPQGPLRLRLPPMLRFAAGCALILVPVGFRNLAAGGEFHLTTSQFGPNFYIGNHEGADGTYQPLVVGRGSVESEREDATRLAESAEGRSLTPSEVSSFWTSQALAYITSQPIGWLTLTARKLAMTLNASERADTEDQSVHAEWSWLARILRPFDFGVLLVLAAVGVLLTARSSKRCWILYAFGAVYALSSALFYVFARYRFPIVPVLMLLAAGGILQVLDAVRLRQTKRLTAAAAIAVLAGVFAHLPVVDATVGRAVNYLSIAATLAEHPERFDQAMDFYNRALTEDPRWPPARYGIGLLLTQAGRPAEAIPHLQMAVAIWPNYAAAHLCLSQALAAIGDQADAEREYGEALRIRMLESR